MEQRHKTNLENSFARLVRNRNDMIPIITAQGATGDYALDLFHQTDERERTAYQFEDSFSFVSSRVRDMRCEYARLMGRAEELCDERIEREGFKEDKKERDMIIGWKKDLNRLKSKLLLDNFGVSSIYLLTLSPTSSKPLPSTPSYPPSATSRDPTAYVPLTSLPPPSPSLHLETRHRLAARTGDYTYLSIAWKPAKRIVQKVAPPQPAYWERQSSGVGRASISGSASGSSSAGSSQAFGTNPGSSSTAPSSSSGPGISQPFDAAGYPLSGLGNRSTNVAQSLGIGGMAGVGQGGAGLEREMLVVEGMLDVEMGDE